MSLLLLFGSVVAPPAIAVREVDDRLALSVTHADGSVTRWAGDEADAELVAGNLEFGSAVPGGFKDLTCELLRGLTPRADEGLFDDVRCYGAGNRTAWEGRMAQLPRTNISLRPGAVGWSAHLEDDQSFSEIYVDRDLTQWSPPSVQRQTNLISASWSTAQAFVQPDVTSGSPALACDIVGSWASGVKPIIEAWYDARGINIGSIYFAWRKGANINAADPYWVWGVLLAIDDRGNRSNITSNSLNDGRSVTGSGTVRSTGAGWPFAFTQFYYSATPASTSAGLDFQLLYTCLAIFGRHGLALQGTGSLTDPPGLLVTDIVRDVVRRGAPLLNLTSDSITTNSFALTHFPNIGPAAPSEWIGRLNAYLLWDWGVWENRTFKMRPPTDDVVWVARLSDGAQLDLEGDQAQDIYNGVVVTFTDPIGRRRTVGPPGASADVTDASLADTDPTNPVNAHGIPRRWAKLDLSMVTTDQGAIQIGGVYLAQAKLAKRRGTLTVTGCLERQGQPGRWPAWMVRAGDYVTVGDRAGEPLRRVIEARYSHSTRTTTLMLDSSAQKLDAILERLNAALVGVLGS